MLMNMKFFSSKKRKEHAAKQPKEKEFSSAKPDVKIPGASARASHGIGGSHSPVNNRVQQTPRQNQHHTAGVNSPHTAAAYASATPRRAQAQTPTHANLQPWPAPNNPPLSQYQYLEERSSHGTNHGGATAERANKYNNTGMPQPGNNNSPVKRHINTPQSILHIHKQPPQHAYSMDASPPQRAQQNHVRFLSSNSSVASSTCASEVHLMAGPGSVASSSAMSSSRGDAENVFDKVLHSVMAEEEDRLKAMGMSKAGGLSGSSRQNPALYYKSPAMYYGGGIGGATSSESDERLSPRGVKPIAKPIGTAKKAAAGTLIDMDTGLRCGNPESIECEYHDLNDEAIDTRKYRDLLGQRSGGTYLNESFASGASDRALNGSTSSFNMYHPERHSHSSNDLGHYQHQQAAHAQYRKYPSHGSEQAGHQDERQGGWPDWGREAQFNNAPLQNGKKASPTKKVADRWV